MQILLAFSANAGHGGGAGRCLTPAFPGLNVLHGRCLDSASSRLRATGLKLRAWTRGVATPVASGGGGGVVAEVFESEESDRHILYFLRITADVTCLGCAGGAGVGETCGWMCEESGVDEFELPDDWDDSSS